MKSQLSPENVSPAVRALNPGLFASAPKLEPIAYPTKGDVKTERELQTLCEHELSRRGIWFLHLSPRSREKAGCPDILACVNKLAFACELKADAGRLSEEQKATLEQMAGNGWHTCVCRSYQQFVEELNAMEGT